ncbi:MAG TPA: hypothetical protein VJ716_09035 [Gaiellaceae bacterium]|nr:hypothetical protein [Gaiellaceae bacterium]
MSTVAPPPHGELEALIREARERQRRRQLALAAGAAVVAAAGLSLWAAIPGRGGGQHAPNDGPAGAFSREVAATGRVPIAEVGTSGGVTWAMNGLGMWLTTNGGRTWRASAPVHVREMGDVVARVEQVDFLDRRHGWLLAVDVRGGLHPAWRRHAELDWTSDGGRTWHWTMPKGCCGYVSLLDPARGYFLGRSATFATIDGGSTWKRISSLPFRGGVPTFVDARRGVAVVGKGDLFGTRDGGRRWTEIRLPDQPRKPQSQLVLPGVGLFGSRLVVPAERLGGPRSGLVVYVSADGGSTWAARPMPSGFDPVIGSYDERRFSAAGAGVWFVAARRELAMTRDAGRTWRRVRPLGLSPRWTIGTIDFTSASVGWAIFDGPHQSALMRTTDGGLHWKPAGPRAARHRRHR